MSTDRKRLNTAIQRIAREDPEISKLLEDYRNSGGKPSESATSGSGAEDRQICCDGSTGGGGVNPGGGTNDPNEDPQDGINEDDPAKISVNLTGVTDCQTGESICFSGSDWIPPPNWDSPTEPGPVASFTLGYYFCSGPFNDCIGIFYSAMQACLARASTTAYAEPYGGDDGGVNSGQWQCYRENGTLAGTARKVKCPDGANNDICNGDNPPIATHWPKDGCVNLAIKGGKIVGSKYDPENDGSWSAPRDEVELCDEFGNKFKLTGSSSGGWKTINPLNPDDGYLYNSSGEQIARISESEYSDPTM